MAQLAVSFTEYWQRCVSCGVWFGVDEYFDNERRRNKGSFYCPNGHSQSYTENEADRIRKQLAAKDKELEQERQRVAMERSMRADADAARLKAEKKLRLQTKRVNAGVCPHCQRTFQQLARHMQCKHAEIVKETA